uniref:Uncharacterized protein n=1 Tax=Arundo donax TaxID=35708 RepID=A0A0A9F734_ARUDO
MFQLHFGYQAILC